jgi:hypothetical protein
MDIARMASCQSPNKRKADSNWVCLTGPPDNNGPVVMWLVGERLLHDVGQAFGKVARINDSLAFGDKRAV